MVKEKYIELKIKLKSMKKFIIAELPSEKYINEFLSCINSEYKIVKFGQIIFDKNEFVYAEYYEKFKIKREKK